MKKKTTVISLIIMSVILLGLAGFLCFYLIQENTWNNPKKKTMNEAGLQTFADQTDVEEFKDIPIFLAKGIKVSEPEDRGGNVYMITVNGTDKTQYESYLKDLEKAGFKFFANNGDGIDDAVYTSSYTGHGVTVTVTHVVKGETTYITSSKSMELSERLIYKDEYVKDNIPGKKTTLYMYELYDYGNSFVIQLKNGHFIISDGGRKDDTPYLVDYMEEMTPDGQKPIVDAWFISHAHADHQGALAGLTSQLDLLNRMYIDGIYMNAPSDEAFAAVNQTSSKTGVMMIETLPNLAKASDGGNTKLYRPQTGQKYYFSDIVVDIVHSQEQLVTEDYANLDLNDSSLWLMFNIEGQKFLLSGDADKGGMSMVMNTYSQDYLKLDMYASFHHNMNNWIPFLEYITFNTTLFTTSGTEAQNQKVGDKGQLNSSGSNQYLIDHSKDYYSWKDGGKAFEFPYVPGTAKSLPKQVWKYHENRVTTYGTDK